MIFLIYLLMVGMGNMEMNKSIYKILSLIRGIAIAILMFAVIFVMISFGTMDSSGLGIPKHILTEQQAIKQSLPRYISNESFKALMWSKTGPLDYMWNYNQPSISSIRFRWITIDIIDNKKKVVTTSKWSHWFNYKTFSTVYFNNFPTNQEVRIQSQFCNNNSGCMEGFDVLTSSKGIMIDSNASSMHVFLDAYLGKKYE